jgi:glyoxylase-like metal-dependent hydrolase (beta-lactamase superfamily II)
MDGSVTTLEREELAIHVYTAPPAGYAVNTIVLELADRLIVVDGQMAQAYAAEAGDVVEGLGKRIDRFVLSHTHPDHYSGFQHLTARFPGVQLAALPAVRGHLLAHGDQVLAVRRSLFGDQVASRAVIPDATIVPGELTIAGVRFLFQQYDETEADHTLTVVLPESGVALLADLVASPSEHLFTLQPHFDAWAAALHQVRTDIARYGITTIVPGHGAPIGPEALPANLEYLQVAKEVHAHAGTSEEYVAGVTARLPDRGPQAWLDWSGQLLYGHVAP